MTDYAKLARNALRWLLAALVVGGLQIAPAHAIKKSQMNGFKFSTNGSNVTIKPNQPSTSGTFGAVNTGGGPTGVIPPGTTGTQIGNSGWYVGASASGNPASGTTMHLGHSGDVFVAGTKYPFQAGRIQV